VSEKDFVGRTKDGEVLLSVGDSEIVVTELCIAKEGCLQKREQVSSEGFFGILPSVIFPDAVECSWVPSGRCIEMGLWWELVVVSRCWWERGR